MSRMNSAVYKMTDKVMIFVDDKDLDYCVHAKKQGVVDIFYDLVANIELVELRDFTEEDKREFILRWIYNEFDKPLENSILVIGKQHVNSMGFYTNYQGLWFAIGTVSDLWKELEEEINYHIDKKTEEENDLDHCLQPVCSYAVGTTEITLDAEEINDETFYHLKAMNLSLEQLKNLNKIIDDFVRIVEKAL